MNYFKKLNEKTRPYIYDMNNQRQEVIQHILPLQAMSLRTEKHQNILTLFQTAL